MFDLKKITRLALVAALYIVITLLSYPLSYGEIQFRISEALILLCFYRKDYSLSFVLGCFITNLFSPLGFIDLFFGTLATLISVILIGNLKNIYVAALMPVIFNGLFVGFELSYLMNTPFLLAFIWVSIGEFVCVFIIGIMIFKILEKKSFFIELILANQNIKIKKESK